MTARVLVVEDDRELCEALCDTLELAGIPALGAGDAEQALIELERRGIGLVVSDVQMRPLDGLELLGRVRALRPELPVLLMTAYGSIEQAVRAMREGAADYLVKPFEAQVLVGKAASLLQGSLLHGSTSDEEASPVAADPASKQLLATARRVADAEVSVLISGESGTGKEVLARFIHRHSRRRNGPFVAINCAAIPENMLEAVLFGYEKGAFTGAHRACPGKFEQAQGGTLLLDEISEMALGLQPKLLRVLQEREVERLGGSRLIALDVRVLATTNQSLREAVAGGRFREDLYYRLSVFPLMLPPLRDRRDDILPIAERLLARAARAQGRVPVPRIAPEAVERLLAYPWPGNVRELDNLLQRALVLQPGPAIGAADLALEPVDSSPPEPESDSGDTLGGELRSREQRMILEALAAEGGHRKAAAERLGISPRTLRYKLARMRADGLAVPGG